MTISRRTLRQVRRLPAGARAELVRVLMSPPNVRADLIRQMFAREDTQGLAEVLIDMEADELLRLQVVEALRDARA